jgi:hypothetical protein
MEQTWIGYQRLRVLLPDPAPVFTAEASAVATVLVLLFRVNLPIPPLVTT